MDSLNIKEHLSPVMDRGRVLSEKSMLVGRHHCELFDKHGNKKEDFYIDNGITNEAKNALFNAYFNNGAVASTWFAGLIDNLGYNQNLPTDTALSHTGWVEFTFYQLSPTDIHKRVPWGQGTASSQQITNTAQMVFTFYGAGTVQGIFLISKQAHNEWTDAYLWSTAIFVAPIPVQVDDILRISYTVAL